MLILHFITFRRWGWRDMTPHVGNKETYKVWQETFKLFKVSALKFVKLAV